ncbi:uncharacterized protein [Choristoneura fumiferana]|uniref:uncharacterized protein n=1 Tax=Choristoneura fumiferana TaxID=7141 RepID=UPI003D15E936
MKILQTNHYGGHRQCNLKKGNHVLVKSFYLNGTKYTWKQGVIHKKIGSRMYIVYIPDIDVTVKKHVDQLLIYKDSPVTEEVEDYEQSTPTLQDDTPEENLQPEVIPQQISPDTSFESITSLNSPVLERSIEVEENGEEQELPSEIGSAEDVTSAAAEPGPAPDGQEHADDRNRRFPLRNTRNKDVNYKI